ncbi:MAG: polysaccharide biosynthesis protein [Proteobacteria bacterium]|nr:polysaccharide biosynthesis protein [Pseudomonadota bacterium]MBU1596351.1 polysaccharide biosynthesis protein [Pseudomonadota bacterium]
MLCNPRNLNFYLMLAADGLCFALALTLSYLLRFDFNLSNFYGAQLLGLLKYVLPLKLGVFLALGLYRGMWRYTSLVDFWKLTEAVVLASALFVALVAFRFGFMGFSRSVLAMDALLCLMSTAGVRLSIRTIYARTAAWSSARRNPQRPARRILVIGAGNLGERLVREIALTPELNYDVVGFLDDDPAKRGRSLHGREVLGGVDDLERVIEDKGVEELCIAVSSASAEQMRRIVEACKASGLPHRILPATSELLEGRVALTLRPVDYLDLLGRTEVALDEGGIARMLKGRVVLVTGCGGSIGSELCRQVARFKPARLVLVDVSEYNLYAIAGELSSELGFADLACVLGSVADLGLMCRVMAEHKPAFVLHAAAYKHVPMLEENPWSAVTNNIFGTRAVMQAAVENGVERFVLVSTDKAVRPTSVMGASKRVTERLMACFTKAGSPTRFMAVRFGNVVGSSGSVVPLFQRQIERGGPVTVTHPEMTRYFMSIAESCQLILQAGAMSRGGEIFVLEMGEPVRIVDMARDLIRLSGKEPGVDVDIVFTGLRPGEKIFEELITEGEGVVRTEHEKIMVLGGTLGADPSDLACALDAALAELAAAAEAQDGPAIRALLARLVPEYSRPDGDVAQ